MRWYEVVAFIFIELAIVAIVACVSFVISKFIPKAIAAFIGSLIWWFLSLPVISHFYDKE